MELQAEESIEAPVDLKVVDADKQRSKLSALLFLIASIVFRASFAFVLSLKDDLFEALRLMDLDLPMTKLPSP